MKERPILFSGPMVRALLDGRKTQTRRIVKPVGNDDGFTLIERAGGTFWPYRSTDGDSGFYERKGRNGEIYLDEAAIACPYGRPGDRLWVKETYSAHSEFGDYGRKVYRADRADGKEPHGLHWRPSIFMSRAASRITLEIVSVRVERLQEISESDAEAEGVELNFDPDNCPPSRRFIESYAQLWESINGPGSWDANPWVWVVEFRRVNA